MQYCQSHSKTADIHTVDKLDDGEGGFLCNRVRNSAIAVPLSLSKAIKSCANCAPSCQSVVDAWTSYRTLDLLYATHTRNSLRMTHQKPHYSCRRRACRRSVLSRRVAWSRVSHIYPLPLSRARNHSILSWPDRKREREHVS